MNSRIETPAKNLIISITGAYGTFVSCPKCFNANKNKFRHIGQFTNKKCQIHSSEGVL